MDYAVLRAEIENDPTSRGYSGKSPVEIADLLNTPYLVPGPDVILPALASPSEFYARFTPAEVQAIKVARESNPVVDWFMDQLFLARDSIRLDDTRIQQGLGMLVQAGLLTAERAAEIGAPPAPMVGLNIQMPARVSVIFAGITDAPNLITLADVETALA